LRTGEVVEVLVWVIWRGGVYVIGISKHEIVVIALPGKERVA
jgi:hypothetical protein